MQRIHIVGNELSFHDFHHPLRVFRRELLDRGIDVRYFFNLKMPEIEACDVLIFHEDNYRSMLPIEKKDRESALNFLSVFFKRFPRVIWFDGNDGSGNLRSYIFPYVDVYAKCQILKDKSYYQINHPTGIIHRDYVKEKFCLPDSVSAKSPITDNDSKKVKLAYSRVFKNWGFSRKLRFHGLMDKIPPKMYNFHYKNPDLADRGKIIQYRVNYWEDKQTINWWRTQTRDRLIKVVNQNPPYILTSTSSVGLRKYIHELENSIVTVSPFGLNELCYRDFWSFITGSLLIKPNMQHLLTYPSLYIEGETYVSHAWDFSDFYDKLDDILTHPQVYETIAQEGQDRFRKTITDGVGFANQFLDMIS